MAPRKSIWFHIGSAYERARQGTPTASTAIAGLADRRPDRTASQDPEAKPTRPAIPQADDLMAAGVAMIVDRALGGWGKRKEPGFSGLVRAGAAGAAAALLVDLVRPLIHSEADLPMLDRATVDRLIAGVGQGLVYGAIVEPRVPGHALVKGALFGSVEYAAEPLGGLSGLLGPHTPQGRLPVIGDVVAGLDPLDRLYLEHLIFGIALALIYESKPSSNGIRPDDV
jgi:hypothetical protein